MTNTNIELTKLSKYAGCGAKIAPGILEKALCGLKQTYYKERLEGFEANEDAGIWQLTEDTALVQTVDFFPPIVDDPFLFGRIAAANALSDIYAMGAKPITALCICAIPLDKISNEQLKEMMQGGLSSLDEAECALLGGHSIEDQEPKLGYAVTGTVHPKKYLKNNSLQEGYSLILTKPIGTGVINTALKAGLVNESDKKEAEKIMTTLNKKACEILLKYQPIACTDITGFGLLGHTSEMAQNPKAGISIFSDRVPLLSSAYAFAQMGLVPEGTYKNKNGRGKFITCKDNFDPILYDLLFDPQTSGGLLAAIQEADTTKVLKELNDAGIQAACIGITNNAPGMVHVI